MNKILNFIYKYIIKKFSFLLFYTYFVYHTMSKFIIDDVKYIKF